MTLWERVEELTRRVGELEQRLPKPIPVVTPLADTYETQHVMVPFGGTDADFEQRMRAVAGAAFDARLAKMRAEGAIAAEPTMVSAESDDVRAVREALVERGLMPPPPSYETRMLEDAASLLERCRLWLCDSFNGKGSELHRHIVEFLARAREALEKP